MATSFFGGAFFGGEFFNTGSVVVPPVVSTSSGGGGRYHYLPPSDYVSCKREIKALEKRHVLVERRIAKLEKRVDDKQEKARYEDSMSVLRIMIAQLNAMQDDLGKLRLKLAEIEEEEMRLLEVCINEAEWLH